MEPVFVTPGRSKIAGSLSNTDAGYPLRTGNSPAVNAISLNALDNNES